MKYYNDKLPEILKSFSRDGYYFAIISVTINYLKKAFEIGLSKKSFNYLNKVLSSRPFDKLPGLRYEYFFVPKIYKNSDDITCKTSFRIKSGKYEKDFDFELTIELTSHLMWFFELKNFEDAKYLKEIDLAE